MTLSISIDPATVSARAYMALLSLPARLTNIPGVTRLSGSVASHALPLPDLGTAVAGLAILAAVLTLAFRASWNLPVYDLGMLPDTSVLLAFAGASLVLALSMQAHAASRTAPGQARSCAAGAARSVQDPRIREAIANARQQHALFGGQVIDRAGGIVAIGFHEAEFDRPAGESTPTWRRVAEFWSTLDQDLPPSIRSPSGTLVDRKALFGQIAAINETSGARRLDETQLGALEAALMRSALVDHPWSAVFISYLMKKSNFSSDEFAFSDSHVDYVDKAVESTLSEAHGEATRYAYRACDAATTLPRAGDMLCFTRQRSMGIDSHARLLEHLEARRPLGGPGTVPMHCDLVTSSDEGGNAKIETIGGNVFQSVTLRRMTLNASKTLSTAYFRSYRLPACARGKPCVRNLSRQPWVVLLQFRN